MNANILLILLPAIVAVMILVVIHLHGRPEALVTMLPDGSILKITETRREYEFNPWFFMLMTTVADMYVDVDIRETFVPYTRDKALAARIAKRHQGEVVSLALAKEKGMLKKCILRTVDQVPSNGI